MLSRTAKRLCTCNSLVSRSSVYYAVNRPANHLGVRFNSIDAQPLPWFVDPSTAPTGDSSSHKSQPKLATAPIPTPPPAHLVESLHPLHAHLSISPFLDRDSITYINSREADPDSWTDWIVIATLRQGRERGIRGAIEGVRSYVSLSHHPCSLPCAQWNFLNFTQYTDTSMRALQLASNPIDLSPAPSPTPFAPPSASPLITGLPTPPSKHARSRSKGGAPSRTEQASGWAMLDAGRTVVHIMTLEARQNWGIEKMWDTVRRSNERSALSEVQEDGGSDSTSDSQAYEELSEADLEAVRRRERANPSRV